MSAELSEAMTETMGLGRRTTRVSRLFGALLADLKSVDSGSLDVLVYCRDELVGSAPGDRTPAGRVDGP
jgi:hypothetical protein